MSPRSESLASWLVRQQGLRKGGRILGFIITWGIAQEDLGADRLTVEQYADYWGEDERTSYRDLDRFRDVFEAWGFDYPTGLLAVVGSSDRVPGFAVQKLRQGA